MKPRFKDMLTELAKRPFSELDKDLQERGLTGPELELKDEDLDLFVAAYETFLGVYLDIISKRKGIAYTESDVQLKLERNGKWLEYIMLKDRAIKAARNQGVPPEVLIEIFLPPSAIF